VGESPPPGRKESVFYNLEVFDRLRLSMKLILNLKEDGEILECLKRSEVFVTAAVKCRPPSFKAIPEMRRNCVSILKEEIRLLKPKTVLAMGRTAMESLCEIFRLKPPHYTSQLATLEAGNLQITFTPHPNYIYRFRRDLAFKIRKLLLSRRS